MIVRQCPDGTASVHNPSLKDTVARADYIVVDVSRKTLALCLALAALVLTTLSGCASEAPPGAAASEAGVVGEFYEQIESEDDESEARQREALREGGPQALEPGEQQLQAGQHKSEMEAEQEQEWN